MNAKLRQALEGLVVLLGSSSTAVAQPAPLEQYDVELRVDSGEARNKTDHRAVIYSTVITKPGAAWLRLTFDKLTLGEPMPGGGSTVIRITSLLDVAVQTLNSAQARQWQFTSAYFNGGTLLVELAADPGSAMSRLVVSHPRAGPLQPTAIARSGICDEIDDRVPSDDPRVARIIGPSSICTAWLINDANRCQLSAGHCRGSMEIAELNVPLSSPHGQIRHPGPEDQYAIDPESIQGCRSHELDIDWAYFGCFENSRTGLTAYEAQGGCFILAAPPSPSGQGMRVTGYGTRSPQLPPEWHLAQKTAVGPYEGVDGSWVNFRTDITHGNSGSPIIEDGSGRAIGIVSGGDCSNPSINSNRGNAATHPGLLEALANPQGVCAQRRIEFAYPRGRPALVPPDGITFRVEVSPGATGMPVPGTGTFHLKTSGSWAWWPMTELSPNEYEVTIPPFDCGIVLDYYFSIETTAGDIVTDPPLAPLADQLVFSAPVGITLGAALFEPMNSDPGWRTEGKWAFGRPIGEGGAYGEPDPTSGYAGPYVSGYNLYGAYENSMPERHLTTNVLDCSNLFDVTLRFRRWLGVEWPDSDRAFISVSTNGRDWTTVWENLAQITDASWVEQTVDLAPWADGEPTVYIRWTMGQRTTASHTAAGTSMMSASAARAASSRARRMSRTMVWWMCRTRSPCSRRGDHAGCRAAQKT